MNKEDSQPEKKTKAYDDSFRFHFLLEELQTSHDLLKHGFQHLKQLNVSMTMHHVPQQMLASGLERLMKCYIALIYKSRNGSFPDSEYMKKFGHDLVKLLNEICDSYYSGTNRRLLQQELNFLQDDEILRECVRILSMFGQKGRYFNLDIVTGATTDLICPTDEWKNLEYRIGDPTTFDDSPKELFEVHYPHVNEQLIQKIERLIRAIALQFTVAGHADPYGMIWDASDTFWQFRKFRDEELAGEEERRLLQLYEDPPSSCFRGSNEEIINTEWPTRMVTKSDFGGEWPFKWAERILLERREGQFSLVNVNCHAYALNTAAKERYKLPFPHEARIAVVGKSIAPIVELANGLR